MAWMQAAATFSSERLARERSANRGYLEVALRLLVCLGWLRPAEDGTYAATAELASVRIIPEGIRSLYGFAFDRYVEGASGSSLAPWLAASEARWHSDHPFLPDYLDGLIVVPLLLALEARRRRRAGEPGPGAAGTAEPWPDVDAAVRGEVERLFRAKGWAEGSGGSLRLNRAGRYLVDRILITAALASYRPMFLRAPELLFGDPARVFALGPAGHETHLDRTLNVLGSGFQHEKYFAALCDMAVPLFDDESYAAQPRYIADTGCGDGSLLRRLYEAVRDRTRRGRVLDSHPLGLVAVDYHAEALAAASRTLAGIEHVAVQGDVGDPDGLLRSLRAHGIGDPGSVLHVRSFLDHDRPYRRPDPRAAARRQRLAYSGVYVDAGGDAIPAAAVVESTVEHLRRWAQVVNRHGLIVLEAHCLPAEVTARFLDQSESFHFDAYQSLSRQLLVEAETFLGCAAEAGLFCRPDRSRAFPRNLPFTRISLHHFERRPYVVRHAADEDLPALLALQQAWPPPRREQEDAAQTFAAALRELPEGQFVLAAAGRIVAAARCGPQPAAVADAPPAAAPQRAGAWRLLSLWLPPDGAAEPEPAQELLRWLARYGELRGGGGGVDEAAGGAAGIAGIPGIIECAAALREGRPGGAGEAAGELAHAVAGEVAATAAGLAFAAQDDPRAAERELATFCFRWLLAILQRMGALREAGERHDPDELERRLGVAPRYHRYFAALLRRLTAEGLLTLDAGRLAATPLVLEYPLRQVAEEVAAFRQDFARRHPGSVALLNLTARCLERYEEILTGRIDVAEALFEQADMRVFAELFHGDAVSDYFNRLVAAAVASAVRRLGDRPRQRESAPGSGGPAPRVRILEIGAGTGGTTAAVLAALPPLPPAAALVEYVFTDVSLSFVRNARRRFAAQYPWVEYRALDVEEDLSRQGFGRHDFDVVVAANVLHDTRDVERTLCQARSLLRPGGLLVLNEYTAVKDCLSFSGALLHGWWLFEDPDRRLPDSCLLSVPQWRRVLERSGFTTAAAFALPTQHPDGECSQSVLLCASRPPDAGAESAAVPALATVPALAAVPPSADGGGATGGLADAGGSDGGLAAKRGIVGAGVEQDILAILGEERAAAYSERRPLMEMGMDSIELVELKFLVGRRLGVQLSPSFLFENETQEKIAQALAAAVSDEQLHELMRRRRGEESPAADRPPAPASEPPRAPVQVVDGDAIAIVGMACRFPGGADSPAAFWRLLASGRDGIRQLPAGRWEWPAFVDVRGKHQGIDQGGFLERIDGFDAPFFRIAPREAQLMDPQQRLLLELGWEAMEDAGYRPSALAGRKVGVFVGACHGDYRELLGAAADLSDAYVGSGSAPSMLANRLSYFYDLKGPSIAVDTACSSSLFALREAVTAIRRGDCEQALAGAVNLLCSPTSSLSYFAAGMLSPTGRCRTFDAAADGYARGEGGAVLLLKPAARAIADGDAIYGLIRGIAVNHGGQAASLTAPKPEAQAAVIAEAWRAAGVAADAAGYVEAHGTATSLGDPVEVSGLTAAFRRLYQEQGRPLPAEPRCGLGSVKSNFGHLEGAAGLAGLVKVLLAMAHARLPRTLHFQRLNPDVELAGSPFYVVERDREWPRPRDEHGRDLPRCAGVSAFGFGGANAHAVVEECLPPAAAAAAPAAPAETCLVPLSARSREQLVEQAARLLDLLTRPGGPAEGAEPGGGGPSLAEIAHTLQVGREPMAERVAFLADSLDQLVPALERFVAGDGPDPRRHQGSARPSHAGEGAGGGSVAGEELREALREAVRSRDLARLAALWTGGAEIDWTGVDPGARPRRVHLPTYPFARQSHWVPRARLQAAAPARVGPPGEPPPRGEEAAGHPLLGPPDVEILACRFTHSLAGDEPFLADHVVGGRRVLPAVAYLEMARAAVERAARAAPGGGRAAGEAGEGVWLKSFAWVRPLWVDGKPEPVELRLAAEGGGGMSVEVYGRSAGPEAGAVLLAQGRAGTGAGAGAPRLDVAAVRDRCTLARYAAAECYRALAALGFEYGPAHRGIDALHVGSNEILARLRMPDSVLGTRRRFVLHPTMADAAIQAAIGFSLAGGQGPFGMPRPALAFELRAAEVLRPCTPVMWAWLRHGLRGGDGTVTLDVDLCDEDGHLCACFRGWTLRPLAGEGQPRPNLAAAAAAVAAPAEAPVEEPEAVEMVLLPAWDPVAVSSLEPLARAWSGGLALVGGTELQRAAVARQAPDARLLPVEPDDTGERIRERIASWGEIGHLVWLVPAASVAPPAAGPPAGADRRGVLFAFRLLQALLACRYDARPLHWTVITTAAHGVHAEELADPAQAAVHGFLGALAKEFPHWRVRLLDMPRPGDGPWTDLFAFAGGPQGDALAWRGHHWHRQRLVRCPPPAAAAPDACRPGGVYAVIGGAGGIGGAWSEAVMRRSAARLAWIGRRPVDDVIRAKLDRLGELGPPPLYVAADATDHEQLAGARDRIKRELGRLDGVIHAAMVVEDRSLASMTEEQLVAAFAAKADVGVRMAQVFGGEALDFALFFSSMNAFWQWPGTSGYAAGCMFEDAFARGWARAGTCRVRVVNWGYWGSVGAAASERYRSAMARRGLASIELPGAMRFLDQLLAGPDTQLAYLRAADPAAAVEGAGVPHAARPGSVTEVVPRPAAWAASGIVEIMGQPRDAAIEQLLAGLRPRVAELLGLDQASLDAGGRPFADCWLSELGLDSITANSLRHTLRQELGVDVPAQQVIAENVRGIAATLYEQLLLQRLSSEPPRETGEETETFVF